MNAVVKMPHPGGRPRIYDREALATEFEAYIEATDIPIAAEFAASKGLFKQLLYEWSEFLNLIKRCTTKKESALERAMLRNEVCTAGAIFSLKQLGWTDRTEQTHKEAMAKPEDVQRHPEQVGHNLEALLIRKKKELKLAGHVTDAEPCLPAVPVLSRS